MQEMLEFGSDFHYMNNNSISTSKNDYKSAILLANGRQAIELLIEKNQWERIWMPEYFCYDIIDAIRKTGIEIEFYDDFPQNDDDSFLSRLTYRDDDVLLRMNYFGLRGWRDSSKLGIPIIEDHSHCPNGQWAIKSNADWCVASLRKTLPIAEGGVLWSPKNLPLPRLPKLTEDNKKLAKTRWEAMRQKTDYLMEKHVNKEEFRYKFLTTEEAFGNLRISLIDDESKNYLKNFDHLNWYRRKQENWQILSAINSKRIQILKSENNENFSFTILCDTKEMRNKLRSHLIKNKVYPTILWNLPSSTSEDALDFSKRMLSIHCDARYSLEDIEYLKIIIEKAISNV